MDNYISIRQILDDALDHPMLADVSFERAVNYAVQFIRIVGSPKIFVEKTEVVDVKDYRGMCPCDMHAIVQVRTHGCGDMQRVFRYSTDSFHMSENKSDSIDLTYKVQGGIIFTSMREGQIEISYRAFATDDEGYPLIPDNESFKRALELYIKKKVFTMLFDQGKLSPQIMSNTQQEYAWAVGQAQTSLIKPSIDEMEAITNMWNTLIPRVREHKRGFVNTGTKESLKIN